MDCCSHSSQGKTEVGGLLIITYIGTDVVACCKTGKHVCFKNLSVNIEKIKV